MLDIIYIYISQSILGNFSYAGMITRLRTLTMHVQHLHSYNWVINFSLHLSEGNDESFVTYCSLVAFLCLYFILYHLIMWSISVILGMVKLHCCVFVCSWRWLHGSKDGCHIHCQHSPRGNKHHGYHGYHHQWRHPWEQWAISSCAAKFGSSSCDFRECKYYCDHCRWWWYVKHKMTILLFQS